MPDREAVKLATEQAARDGLAYCPYDAWVHMVMGMPAAAVSVPAGA